MQASTLRLWTAVILSDFSAAVFSQVPAISYVLPPQQAVTNGRNVLLTAPGPIGPVRWQVSKGGVSWSDLADDSTYQGASNKTLEISGVTMALDGLSYRFVTASSGVTSNATKLIVSPSLLPMPSGISLDGMGGLYVSDASGHTIRHIDQADEYGFGNPLLCWVRLVAGKNGEAGSTDGPAGVALFNQPGGLAVEANGNLRTLLVADTANGTICRIAAEGTGTLAGSSTLRGNVDGDGATALFSAPMSVARAADGSLFIADAVTHTIRKLSADGKVSTFAGSPGDAGTADGTGTAARFNHPTGIAIDGSGMVFVADTFNNVIRRITPAGEVTTLAGLAGVAGADDGMGSQARFNGPTGLAALGTGVFVADTGNSTIRTVTFDGKVTTYAGIAGVAGLQDTVAGYWTEAGGYQFPALFNQPRAIAWNRAGLLFIADTGNAAIRVISNYDGWALTLPLAEVSGAYLFPGQVPTSLPAPSTPATPVSNTSSPAASGGGALGGEFVLALAGIWLLRKLSKRGN